jgi:hypothetical protein
MRLQDSVAGSTSDVPKHVQWHSVCCEKLHQQLFVVDDQQSSSSYSSSSFGAAAVPSIDVSRDMQFSMSEAARSFACVAFSACAIATAMALWCCMCSICAAPRSCSATRHLFLLLQLHCY